MLSLHTFGPNFQRRLGQLTQGNLLNAGPVVLRWNAAAAPTDRNVEADYAEPDEVETTVQALIHYVSMRTVERGFAEMQAGDAIVTFDSTQDLTQRGLSFVLPDGKTYVQAAVGKKLNEFWDVVIGGVPLSKTLLLRQTPTT